MIRGAARFQIGWIFGKVLKGGRGVIFNPKIYIAKFGPLNRAFWPWKWYKKVFLGYVFTLLPCWTFVLRAQIGCLVLIWSILDPLTWFLTDFGAFHLILPIDASLSSIIPINWCLQVLALSAASSITMFYWFRVF